MSFKTYTHSVFDTDEVLERYRQATKGKPLIGKDDTIVNYRKRRIVRTHLVEAPWSYVLGIALLSGIGIAMIKVTWFHYLGKPSFHTLDDRIEIINQENTKTENPLSNLRNEIRKIR